MLAVEDAWAQAEIAQQAQVALADLGWVLHPTTAATATPPRRSASSSRLCFEDLGLRRVTPNCFADNTASWRLMERVGMRRETYAVKEPPATVW